MYVSKKVFTLKLKKYLQNFFLLSVPTQNIKKVHNYTNSDKKNENQQSIFCSI